MRSSSEHNTANQPSFSGSDGEESAHRAGDLGSIPGSGRPPEGNGNPLQGSSLEYSTGSGAWQASVREVAESDTTEQLSYALLAAEMNTALQINYTSVSFLKLFLSLKIETFVTHITKEPYKSNKEFLQTNQLLKANDSLLYVESKKQNQWTNTTKHKQTHGFRE